MNRMCPAHTAYALGILLISLLLVGCPEYVYVPDVAGLSQEAAETAITEAGLAVGTVTTAYSDTVSVGEVISQNPAASMMVALDTAMDFVVSLGSDPNPAEGELIWYVDKNNSSGVEDGMSWETAFTSIQAGIDAAYDHVLATSDALPADVYFDDVWVAEGVYGEERTSYLEGYAVNTGSIMMQPGVHLYGGFTGVESAQEERDWETHVTSLDGSIARNGEAAYHVILGADDAVLDGFTITGGNADGARREDPERGGGMYNKEASPTVTRCLFYENSASWGGGGIYNHNSSPTLVECVFQRNTTEQSGGGMANEALSSPVVTACQFEENTARRYGGGIYNDQSFPEITSCDFVRNHAGTGGGICNWIYGNATITGCLFSENHAGDGGAIYNGPISSPIESGCIFMDNTASRWGGAIFNFEYWFYGCDDTNCHPDGCKEQPASLALDRNTQVHKTIQEEYIVDTFIENCVFLRNSAAYGGGVFNWAESGDDCECQVLREDDQEAFVFSTISLTNCTFHGNDASESGSAINSFIDQMYPETEVELWVRNCVFWGNAQNLFAQDCGGGAGDRAYPMFIAHSNIQGGRDGEGNIDADPLFVDAAIGVLRLQAGSPCIDTATADGAPDADIDGVTRPQGAGVDMGAYEHIEGE